MDSPVCRVCRAWPTRCQQSLDLCKTEVQLWQTAPAAIIIHPSGLYPCPQPMLSFRAPFATPLRKRPLLHCERVGETRLCMRMPDIMPSKLQ